MSSNIEDRRGGGGAGFGGMPGIGCGGAVILLVLSLLTGKNFFAMFDGGAQGPAAIEQGQQAPPASETPEEKKSALFVSFVLDDAQATWAKLLPEQQGVQYRAARLVLFRNSVSSACGSAQSASGPFYCPGDERVYLDMSFFDDLHERFGAPGDFAQAYVIAHEIGHHVQTVLGISEQVQEAMQRDRRNANEYSVRLELQADCFAGLWGHSTQQRQILEEGEVDEALNAASAIGDDRMQKSAGRSVNPDSFTHGSSAQRVEWFRRGFSQGTLASCDTFADMR
jgi:hypothetical protein